MKEKKQVKMFRGNKMRKSDIFLSSSPNANRFCLDCNSINKNRCHDNSRRPLCNSNTTFTFRKYLQFTVTILIFLIITKATEISAAKVTLSSLTPSSKPSTTSTTTTAKPTLSSLTKSIPSTGLPISSDSNLNWHSAIGIDEKTKSDSDAVNERKNRCESTAFQCNDGVTCIPLSWRCDGKNDCKDHSDESGCAIGRHCESHQFECGITQKCIPQVWVCDGDYDCGPYDTSDEDEEICRTKEKCSPNHSECLRPNGSGHSICIETAKFCDKTIDCIIDEYTEYCDNSTLKAECNALNCSYGCKPTPFGAKCYCSNGQQPKGTLCEDIDECSTVDICDQNCKNIPNSFECSCVDGYKLVNKTNCKAINVPANEVASLVFITENDIRRISLDSDLFNKSQPTRTNIQTFDIWHANRSCCLINGSNDNSPKDMTCFSIDDFSKSWKFPHPEIVTGLSSVDLARIDWITGNWYFVNTDAGMIALCNQQLTICSIVIEIYGQKLNTLEIDPTKGYIFFTASESFGNLHRANLDGSNHTIIDSYKIFYPTSLKLDLANQQVYWMDKYMNYIERVDYNGKNRWSMKNSVNTYLVMRGMHSISLFENRVFITIRAKNRVQIWSVNKRESNLAEMIYSTDKQPLEMRVFHRQNQPATTNPCANNNGGCEQLCVPAHDDNSVTFAQCKCSAGYELISQTHCTLVKHSSFLIYAKQSPAMIRGISMSNTSAIQSPGAVQESIVPILNVKWPLSLDYNVKQQLIYFGQNDISANEFIIESQQLDGTNRKVILRGHDHCHAIAYDWIGNNMFWASSTKLEVFSLDDPTLTKTLVYTINAGSLALDAKSGLLYWSTWASNDHKGQIMAAWMDGTHRSIFVDANDFDMQWPSSLTIDLSNKKLYWCDPRAKTIERIGLDRTNREIIIHRGINDNFYPFSMAYHNEYIFYTDVAMGNITKVHITKAGQKENYEILAQENRRVTDIKVFDNLTQTETGNCRSRACPGLLFTTPNGCMCVCGNGFSLNASGTKCLPQQKSTVVNECGPDRFQCTKTGECIDQKYLCDGDHDCNDGSDEAYGIDGPCNARFNCTNLGEKGFRCDEDRCIRNSSVCDGVPNCFDGSDENPEHCTIIVCAADKFQCKQTKQCIPKNWLCDGHQDCADRSDEMENCTECVEFKCNNSVCISSSQVCDGNNNCGDNSDEEHCEHECRHDEHFCHPKGCISNDKICDSIVDCVDASDEEGCDKIATTQMPSSTPKTRGDDAKHHKTTEKPRRCADHEFQCTNWSECVPLEVQCDGYHDCFDRSDEKNCTEIKSRDHNVTLIDSDCTYPDRICKINGHCIHVHQLCDGHTDCADGSDEGGRCDEKNCDTTSECSHFCQNAPEGFVCYCPLHLFLGPNGYGCSEQHACEHWGTCSQVCEQIGKRYKCKCRDGYTLQFDQFTCRSDNSDSPYVIFSNREEIRGVDLRTLGVKNFFASLRNTIAIDFLLENDTLQIFWTDVIDDKIYRGTLIGDVIRNIEVVVYSGLLTAEGLAVDWLGNNLYWVDSNLDQIEVAQINGSFRRTLIAGEMDSPRALALDPREGLLFWTDWDKSDPRIERCSMAGEYRQTIIQVDKLYGGWPNGLTLDYAQKRIYYIDAHSDSIHTTNYDGNDHHLVIRDQETLSHPFSISLFENHVYWTDWRTNSVMRANKWNGSDVTAIDRTSSQPFGIQILHSSRQPRSGISPCAINNAGCSHLCLISVSQTYKCECPHVMQLSRDNKTCIQNEQVLLFMVGSEIRGVDVAQTNHHIIPTISHATHVLGSNVIDFLFGENRLFWTDRALDEIRTSGLANGHVEVILNTDLSNMGGFAIDYIARNLYVSTERDQRSKIRVCNLRGEFITDILSNLFVVSSIALNPAKGIIYFAHGDKSTNMYYVEKCSLNGSNCTKLVNSTKAVSSLAFDNASNRLYFVYPKIGGIDYLDLTTAELHQVLVPENVFIGHKQIEAMTVYKDEIYFSETTESKIERCNKDACTNHVLVRNNKDTVPSLRIYHSAAQSGENACLHTNSTNNKCAHLCLATSETEYVCKCAIGYNVDPNDASKCIGISDFLFYSIGHELKGINMPDTQNVKLTETSEDQSDSMNDDQMEHVLAPISRISLATNIDYHYQYDVLFYADSDKGEITRIKRDGTDRRVIVNQTDQFDANGGDWLSGIAVDWVADNIYWSDEKRNIIEVARLDGSSRYVVLSYVSKPKSLAVDPIAGFLFFAGDKKIERTGLDGSQQFTLANQSAQVTNLVLDTANQVVYWCESASDTIWRVDYDGNNKVAMLNHSLDNPVAVALYDSYLFWADNSHQRGSIKMAPVSDLSQSQVVLSNSGNLFTDLKIFSNKIQKGENPCSQSNGGCEELCLFNGTHQICACSHGEISPIDKVSCVPYDEFLIYSRVVSIESIHLTNNLNMNSPVARIQHPKLLRNTIGLSYSYEQQRIFYSDVHSSSINWVFFNGSDHQMIVNKQVSVEGLAYDSISHNLFWTSNSDASIRAIDISKINNDTEYNFSHVKPIIQLNAQDKPRGIAAEPCLGMIYWTNWNSEAASIQRAYVTGYNLESIITTDIRMPNAIVIDYENHKFYWADARLDKIERVNYDGSHRVVLAHSTPKHPFAMAVYKNYLYWTDWVLRAVLRVNKFSGVDVVWLRKDIGRLMGIVAIQNTTQDCWSSPCSVLNGGCEDVCSVVSGKVKCECTSGTLSSDGRSCIQTNRMCEVGQFKCKSKECIPFTLTCDSVPHCMDGSDEHIDYCNVRLCPSNYFMCNNHRCIPINQTCDGTENCGDGSDEAICKCKSSEHFKCGTGQCIEKTYRCDDKIDCPDGSDEMNCQHNEEVCTGSFRKCANTSTCYMDAWHCDGEQDCFDKSDELDCPNVTCSGDKFQCANGQCISISWRCDGEKDCDDNSDELNCSKHGTLACKPNYFRCADSSLCIPATWQCDESPDCADGSDEGEHCHKRECDESMFRCGSNGRCIPMSWRCDGDIDCGEDEVNCMRTGCPESMFECDNHQCIDFAYYCDGSPDCHDSSDELPGCIESPLKRPRCESEQFECDNGHCLPKSVMCNLVYDCEDGSDENATLCKNSSLICAGPDFYRCANGACVLETKLCNGENDCGDFSDEQACNINECQRTAGRLCAHKCEDRKVGYECTCDVGFKVNASDRHLCEDVNECLDRPCSQNCTNSYGSYHCSCADGYALKDKHICKAVTNEPVKLIFSNRYYLRETDLHGHASLIAHNLSNAVALDYDWETKCYFWSDVTSTISKIKRMCQSDNKTVEIHKNHLKNPDGLAVDWVAKNIYWCDKGLDTIEVSKLDGRYRKVLIQKDLQEPRAIAVDPYDKYLYWTDWGDRPHIGKAGLDGSNPRILAADGFGWPNALTINFETKEIFFGDAREDFIGVMSSDGKNRKIIISREKHGVSLHHIFALAVFEDRIFYTDWETKSIESCRIRGDNCSTLLTTIHRPMDVRVFHSYRQRPAESNPCATANCETLCLLSPEPPYFKCDCPNKFYLAPDNRTCIANCTSAEFECPTKKCIPFFWRCDTQDDCGDGSDEPPSCRQFKCEPGQFQCTNSNCIKPSQICDGKNHCGDNSDEIDCDKFVCFDKQFKCSASANKNAFCIDNTLRCDGVMHCPKGDDEAGCIELECPRDKFKCQDGKCIPWVWVCDGDNDCAGNHDEENCHKRNCSENEFRCESGRCIPKSWKCDGEFDCPTREDEPPSCKTEERKCTDPNHFRCNNGKCIPKRWQCDYDFDCADKSDEANCTMRNCSESEFRCKNGRCIPGRNKCDGEFNCIDFSDEENCNITCAADQFKCLNHNFCISNQFLCDGDNDCADGSDELNCTCATNQFQCNDGRCIENRWRCDGWMDCLDNSDETIELCSTIACGQHAHRCRNKRCIKRSSVCDGIDDCGDKSDESSCSIYQRCSSKQFQCERDQYCISKQFRCDGEPNCVDDSDEIGCPQGVCSFGVCSQICLEKKSKVKDNFNCRCANGYVKGPEKNDTCVSFEEPLLLIASDTDLRFILPLKQMDSEVHGLIPISKNKIDVFDVRILPDTIFLYYISVPNRTIQKLTTTAFSSNFKRKSKRATTSAEQEPITIITSIKNPKSLAIDWIGERIYILDAEENQIISTDLNGGEQVTIVSSGARPLDIVVDPSSRTLFWSTLDNGILSASMCGAKKQAVIERGIEWATGLTIDYPTQRLYWADHRKGTIETSLLNGKGRHVVTQFTNRTMLPKRLQVFEDSLYITLYDQTIYRVNKFGHTEGEVLVESFQRASDLFILHPLRQDLNISNPCLIHPCQNQHICLLSSTEPTGRACKCPDHLSEFIHRDTGALECRAPSDDRGACSLICNQGLCKIINGQPKCKCPIDYEGDFCEHYRCSGYCKNRGVCYVDVAQKQMYSENSKPPLKCKCSASWTGDRCDIPVATCREQCHNGATCTKKSNGVESCICPSGFFGPNCEHCNELKCENQGICRKDETGAAVCDCPNDYMGTRCEDSVCEGYCSGHGQCIIRFRTPLCECEAGFWGRLCEYESCTGYCENGGTCTISVANVTVCDCPPNFTGTRCETYIEGAVINRSPCDDFNCQNGGTCHVIKNDPYCNCTSQYNGPNCQVFLGYVNPCVSYCENNAICQLDRESNPSCVCDGEWNGSKCNRPPNCLNFCGDCIPGSSINECVCSDESILPCTAFKRADNESNNVFNILCTLMILFIILILTFGSAIYILRKRRICQPFSHARLNDCVEMTNPMYLGEIDDTPAFIHDDTKQSRFTNPVYESMYADSSQPTLLNSSGDNSIIGVGSSTNIGSTSSALEEKTGLLQQDEPLQDLL